PGQILISEALARPVGPYFVLQSLGEVAVKGKALPVRTHRVEAARAVRGRLEAIMEGGLTTLVGRERELALLQDRFAEVQAGRGQVVFLFGEPGVGKARLLLECRRHVEAAGARWLTGRRVAYSRTTSSLATADLVDGIAATPVLVLLTHRPGYTPPFQDQTYVSRITLRGLSAAQAVGLVGSVLRADSVPAAAVELITRRAEGNPLFVEELSRALL